VLCLTPSHRDMDEWSLALLSCKVSLVGVEAGSLIKRRGDNSEYAYILLGGGAKVR
jgi:CRP-like cAMP-binding protein